MNNEEKMKEKIKFWIKYNIDKEDNDTKQKIKNHLKKNNPYTFLVLFKSLLRYDLCLGLLQNLDIDKFDQQVLEVLKEETSEKGKIYEFLKSKGI